MNFFALSIKLCRIKRRIKGERDLFFLTGINQGKPLVRVIKSSGEAIRSDFYAFLH
jgi:hypothetical protein